MKNENLFDENKNASGNSKTDELPEENADNKSKKVGEVLFEKNFSDGYVELLKKGKGGS